jgi:hypothetical protein
VGDDFRSRGRVGLGRPRRGGRLLGAHATTALIVSHQGRIVTERYWHGWTPSTAGQIASAGKSVAAVLVARCTARAACGWTRP